ncbi:hypothetical protein LCL89_02980 [Halobacillus yeomjeoni]|uniref:YphA family membrane protein n=1 Tax=Halobacillus yeomjeoni TaxID=311194 RepID=UPI001CD74BC6|nr:hypothetical protein [Halobacillus yeomjeoni]MCA0983007.1 hypothetical protein [Halobacillus yeomjeoni]
MALHMGGDGVMEAEFYWYSWVIVIILFFFTQKASIRNPLLLLCSLLMITYNITPYFSEHFMYIHTFTIAIFGIYYWIRNKKRFLLHVWPFVLSIGYTSIQLFFLVNPVWLEFPGLSLLVFLLLYIFHKFSDSVESLIGMWFLVNACGTLWSYSVFSLFSLEGLIEMNVILLFVIQGLLWILILNGVDHLKAKVQKQKSRKKGAAWV